MYYRVQHDMKYTVPSKSIRTASPILLYNEDIWVWEKIPDFQGFTSEVLCCVGGEFWFIVLLHDKVSPITLWVKPVSEAAMQGLAKEYSMEVRYEILCNSV